MADGMMKDILLLSVVWILCVKTVVGTVAIEQLTGSSVRCSEGRNTASPLLNSPCTAVTDNNITTSYTVPADVVWFSVTMETLAIVTMVDITFLLEYGSRYDRNIRLRLVFSELSEDLCRIDLPAATPEVTYVRQRIVLARGELTKNVIIAWGEELLPAIADVTLHGHRQGIVRLPASCITDNCPLLMDENINTFKTLQKHNTTAFNLTAPPATPLTTLAVYTAPTRPNNRFNMMDISLLGSDNYVVGPQQLGRSVRTQGWEAELTWQIITLPIITSPIAAVVLEAASRDVPDIAEVQFYHVDADIDALWPVDVGHSQFACLGEVLSTPPVPSPPTTPETPSTPTSSPSTARATPDTTTPQSTTPRYDTTASDDDTTTVKRYDDISNLQATFAVNDITTTLPPSQTTAQPTPTERNSTTGILVTFSNSKAVTTSLHKPHTTQTDIYTAKYTTDGNTLAPRQTWWRAMPWYWYLVFAIVIVILVIVLVIIIIIARMRSRRLYTPHPARPRVTLRSISTTGESVDAISLMTPTRGYYHWALSSQSSLPQPYAGLSPNNTTTFGRNVDTDQLKKMALEGSVHYGGTLAYVQEDG